MKVKTFKAKSSKPKVWSRKDSCPVCGVSTGSAHSKRCSLVYEPFNQIDMNEKISWSDEIWKCKYREISVSELVEKIEAALQNN